jgi:hypothetical protein
MTSARRIASARITAPERYTSSPRTTETAAGTEERRSLWRDAVVMSILLSSSIESFFRSRGSGSCRCPSALTAVTKRQTKTGTSPARGIAIGTPADATV